MGYGRRRPRPMQGAAGLAAGGPQAPDPLRALSETRISFSNYAYLLTTLPSFKTFLLVSFFSNFQLRAKHKRRLYSSLVYDRNAYRILIAFYYSIRKQPDTGSNSQPFTSYKFLVRNFSSNS